MKFSLCLSLWLCGSVAFAADVQRDINRLRLAPYGQAGAAISRSLEQDFANIIDHANPVEIVDRLDQSYADKLEPGSLDASSAATLDRTPTELLRDVQNALELRRWYAVDFRGRADVRERISNIFIGLAHVLEVRLHQDLVTDPDDLLRLRQHLLSQGTFLSKGGSRLGLSDLWWDWMWLRGHDAPADLVEMHLQKVKVIKAAVSPAWQERLREYSLGQVLSALARHSEPLLQQEKGAVVSLRLVNEGLLLVEASTPPGVLQTLKLAQYKYLQATGQTYEASQLKKDIAKDLFFTKGKQLLLLPAAPWARTDIGFFAKLTSSTAELFRSFLMFLTYGAGFLFVATPIELFLVVGGAFILARQARVHFGVQDRDFKTRWLEHRLLSRDGWRRLPAAARDGWDFAKGELRLAWRMFVASYTSSQVPFYSKVAASLLLFGVGLYFNSARTLVETVVSQMTM